MSQNPGNMRTGDEIHIRPVETADIPAVRAQLVRTWHATYDALYGPDRVAQLTSRWHGVDALIAQVNRPNTAFLLAHIGDHVLASSYAGRLRDGSIHVARLYVLPEAQGRGLGRALLDQTLAALPGARRQWLEVEPKNHRAIRFYERQGFTTLGLSADCGSASGVPALIMARIT